MYVSMHCLIQNLKDGWQLNKLKAILLKQTSKYLSRSFFIYILSYLFQFCYSRGVAHDNLIQRMMSVWENALGSSMYLTSTRIYSPMIVHHCLLFIYINNELKLNMSPWVTYCCRLCCKLLAITTTPQPDLIKVACPVVLWTAGYTINMACP